MPYHAYILKSLASGRHYYGHTQNLEDRLERHQQNRERATKGRGPWKLIYTETFDTRAEAMKREKFFKSRVGWRWLKAQHII